MLFALVNNQLVFLGIQYIIENYKDILDGISLLSLDNYDVISLVQNPISYGV